ncbi:thiamine-phosphate kinase [Fodinibius sp. Rm-B-1B1-1]|uniref:thiamine-phosphate kinase n=1 Tax=Fodinibius alkaliphilus TaxID=3140241 RepID=UPI00315B024E
MDKDSFRTIQSIGRTELIDELMEHATFKKDCVTQSYGDDTAVLDNGENYQLLSSETFMEGVDFDLTYVPLHHLGYKIAVAAVSDIYAMNGTPDVVLVNFAVPNKISVDMLKEIYRGIGRASEDFEFEIVGGDLTASHQILSASISCYGKVSQEKIAYRKGAHKDDAICVTGDLGGAIAGLRILMREKEYWEEQGAEQAFQPELDDYEYVVKRQLVPIGRKDFIEKIDELNIVPSSMIDITQGLVSELKHLADASEVGAHIYGATIPISLKTRHVADEMKEDVDKYALYGGEDFELMFTLPEKDVEKLTDEFSDFAVIGKITEQEEGVKMQQAEGDMILFDEPEEEN